MATFLKYLLTIGFLSVFLVACGTNTDQTISVNESTNTNDVEQTVEETKQETEQEQEIEKENDELQQEIEKGPEEEQETVEQESEEKDSVEVNPSATEMNISYSVNGESKQEAAIWTKSDNQEFGLYILPTYELTSEEPGIDQLFFKENDSHYMRIQILPGDSDQKESTLAQLKAINENVQTLSPVSDEFFQNATIMQAKKDNEIVTAFLIQQGDKIIKLMIFTNEQENHQDAFLQMAKNLKVD
jgi:hypothetical protein